MRVPRFLIWLLLTITSISVQAQSRLERLQQSLKPVTQLVPGVTRGLEGDPRTETWASRCDRHKDANSCWLLGVELAPMFSFPEATNFRYREKKIIRLGVRYLNRACELGSSEACADLGDFYRYKGSSLKSGEYRADLRIALESYKKSCALDSAYGCYLLAEFNDRGIATKPDPALGRTQFQELCSSGLSVACYRATQPPAPVYPYKVFSALDSPCSTNEDCWKECKNGIWGACNKINIQEFQTLKAQISDYTDAIMTTKNELYSTQARACAEGSDFGCGGYSGAVRVATCAGNNCFKPKWDKKTVKPLVLNGCLAGSESACLTACTSYADVNAPLECERRMRTYAGVEFVDKGMEQRMRECFAGGARGCFDFLPNVPWKRQVPLSAAEQSAYMGSELIFYRMACNAGFTCQFLADYYRSSDPNRSRAYAIADAASESASIFQSFTPIERIMAHRVFLLNLPKSLSDDVVTALDQMCSSGGVHPCALLAEYFQEIAVSQRPEPDRQKMVSSILKYYDEELEGGEASAHRKCDGLPSSWVGTIIVVRTPASDACHRGVRDSIDQLRKDRAEYLDFARIFPTTIYEYNVPLKERALNYWSKACSLGDDNACSTFTSLLSIPNLYAR